MSNVAWEDSKFFMKTEFDCSHTGDNEMKQVFIDNLNVLRENYGKAMLISSGYRSPEHPIEARKKNGGGMHTTGLACDVLVSGKDAHHFLKCVLDHGCWTGIGVSQKGDRSSRFIHFDMGTNTYTRPTIWSY